MNTKQWRGFHASRRAARIYKSASLESPDKRIIFTCSKRNASQTTRGSAWSTAEGKVCWPRSCLVLVQIVSPPEPEQITFTCPRGREERQGSHPVLTAQRKGSFIHAHRSALSQATSAWRKHDLVGKVSSTQHYTTACLNRDKKREMQYVRMRKKLPEPFPYLRSSW